MGNAGKMMVVAGLALAVLGAIVWSLGRAGFKGLPGDVDYQGRNVRVYFPVVSCLVLSALLTLGMWLWRWMQKK
jgi:hypothetical protein